MAAWSSRSPLCSHHACCWTSSSSNRRGHACCLQVHETGKHTYAHLHFEAAGSRSSRLRCCHSSASAGCAREMSA
jgi:hypothetical protein